MDHFWLFYTEIKVSTPQKTKLALRRKITGKKTLLGSVILIPRQKVHNISLIPPHEHMVNSRLLIFLREPNAWVVLGRNVLDGEREWLPLSSSALTQWHSTFYFPSFSRYTISILNEMGLSCHILVLLVLICPFVVEMQRMKDLVYSED